MENPFIDKIRQIILNHLDDENFGVSQLASEISWSKSQLYRKVKSLSGKSVNQFINEIRLQEAAKLILESDLHASEISYKVGFSSPSYFNKCFSKYFGVTPGEYKENPQIKTFDQPTSRSGIKKLQIVFYILGASLLLFVSISIVKKIINPPKVSVAVLYFDDHSPDSYVDMHKYSSAVTEAITLKISNLNNLMVTSRSSVKQYRDSDKTIPEITKALGVDNVIEGSTFKFNDSVLITVQLIDKNDRHKWSKTFSDSYENSLELLNKVSKYIASKFEIEISTEEEKRIDYIPTNNLEAFQLFSEGLSYVDLIGVENLESYRIIQPGGYKNLRISDSLFRRAIDLDPNYAEAIAEKAFGMQLRYETYRSSFLEKKFKEIDSLNDRSIEINPNTVRVYSTKGLRQGYNYGNWSKAEEFFVKGLEINPNDATNRLYYALALTLKPDYDYKKALEQINIAQKLNPHSTTINYDKIDYLLKNNKFTEAEEFYKNNNSFFTESLKRKIKIKLLKGEVKKISFEKKDWTEAINFYHKKIENEPKNAEIYRLLAEAYDEILYDAPNFLKYAEKAFELDTLEYIFKRTIGFALLRNKKFEEHLYFLKRYRNGAEAPLYTHYYFERNFEKAQIYLGKFFQSADDEHAKLYAFQNKLKETYQFLNKSTFSHLNKAVIFAIMKERDSMYYYINKETDIYNIRHFNSLFEVDPYRKDERYKALLKKHYLPLTDWNE